jgi:hypothetical protein
VYRRAPSPRKPAFVAASSGAQPRLFAKAIKSNRPAAAQSVLGLSAETAARMSGMVNMARTTLLSLALLVAGANAALAQFPPQPPPPALPGSEQERAACHPDVVKFCQAELAANKDDVMAILGCLQRNRSQISAACREVLDDNGQ